MGGATALAPGTKSSIMGTFQNLVKPFVGAGILALPVAYQQGGAIASTIMIICMAIVAVYCIQCLLACLELMVSPEYHQTQQQLQQQQQSHHITGHAHVQRSDASSSHYANASSPLLDDDSQSNLLRPPAYASSSNGLTRTYTEVDPPSFREIGYAAFGNVGMYALDVSLAASQLGFCATYMNFVGATMPTVISQVSKTQWIMLMFALQCVLCQIRRISTIAFTSSLGNLVYAVSIVIIFYVGFSSSCCSNASELKLFDASGLPAVFGTACFALEGIGLVLPVKFSMSLEDRPRFNGVLYAAVVLVTTLYIVFGGFGYLFFGSHVLSPVTNNLDSWSVVVVNASLSLSLFFSYIIQLYPVMEMSDSFVRYVLHRNAVRAAGVSETEELDVGPNSTSSLLLHSPGADHLRYIHDRSTAASATATAAASSAPSATIVYREGVRSSAILDPYGSSADAQVVATSTASSSSASNIFTPRRSLRTVSGDSLSASSSSSSSSSPLSSSFSNATASGVIHSSASGASSAHSYTTSSSAASLIALHATLESPAYARRVFIYECTLRVLIVAFTALVALVVPNMKFLIDLTGALANSMIAFVLPTLYYLKLVVHPQYPLFDALLVGEPFFVRLQHYRSWFVPSIVILIACAASVIGVESTISSVA